MNLNIELPKSLLDELLLKTGEEPVYCALSDIDLEGNYSDRCYFGASKSYLFVFYDKSSRFIPLKECSSVKNSNMINGGAIIATVNGSEELIIRYSMNRLSRFAYIARGVQLLIDGDLEHKIESREAERVCPKCGRVLPGTKRCPKCENKALNIKRIFSMMSTHKLAVIIIVLIMLADNLVVLAKQFIFKDFIDNNLVPQKGTVSDVMAFFLFLVLVSVASTVLWLSRFYICNKLGAGIGKELRQKMMSKLQDLSLSFINKRNPGELIHRVTGDTERVKSFLQEVFCDFFSMLIMLVSVAILMLILNWKLALASFAFSPIVVIFSRTFWPHIRRIFHQQWKKYDKINNKLQDILSGIRVVKVFGKDKAEAENFYELNDDYAKTQKRNEIFFAAVHPILSLFLSFGSYLIVYLGGLDVLVGNMTTGELVQFINFSGLLLGPLGWMSFLPRRIVQTTTSIERIYDVLDESPEINNSPNAEKHDIVGNINFSDVVFGYRSYEPVLDGINLDVKPGEMIGLVGASGSGKSTLINLVMRLYDPDAGTITIDGKNLKNLDIKHFHSQIGVVLQETFLFAGTVLDNIKFAKPDATLEEVILAAKRANAHEFISKMPDGYNTYIGERGHNVSGGEKQRIAIARAILNEPRLLILDEATSALDTESEYQIQEALERLREGRTTFAIAHRLSTLRAADRIAVIDGHKIAELGTHNELLKQKGIYYDLVMAQLQMSKTQHDN